VLRTYERGKPIGGTIISIQSEVLFDMAKTGVSDAVVHDAMITIEHDIRVALKEAKKKLKEAKKKVSHAKTPVRGTRTSLPTKADLPSKADLYVDYALGGGTNHKLGPFKSIYEARLEACRLIKKHGVQRIAVSIVNADNNIIVGGNQLHEFYQQKYLAKR
jgi:hypothetical protein